MRRKARTAASRVADFISLPIAPYPTKPPTVRCSASGVLLLGVSVAFSLVSDNFSLLFVDFSLSDELSLLSVDFSLFLLSVKLSLSSVSFSQGTLEPFLLFGVPSLCPRASAKRERDGLGTKGTWPPVKENDLK
ncbi:hypothetical protein EBZ37_08990 [bacterium]|nr:hypothetical protein [bacterium]